MRHHNLSRYQDPTLEPIARDACIPDVAVRLVGDLGFIMVRSGSTDQRAVGVFCNITGLAENLSDLSNTEVFERVLHGSLVFD